MFNNAFSVGDKVIQSRPNGLTCYIVNPSNIQYTCNHTHIETSSMQTIVQHKYISNKVTPMDVDNRRSS